MIGKVFVAAVLATSSIAFPAQVAAQGQNLLNQQGGLVNVSVGNVSILDNFLTNAEIDILRNAQIPITVQLPINVAANVCGVAVNVLARGGPSRNTCDATNGSTELAQAIRQQYATLFD